MDHPTAVGVTTSRDTRVDFSETWTRRTTPDKDQSAGQLHDEIFLYWKARRRLIYKPLVGLEEGLRLAVEDYIRRRKAEQGVAYEDGVKKD